MKSARAQPDAPRLLAWLPLLLALLFSAVTLLPELRAVANLNDDAFHFLLVQGADGALSGGANPVDFWSPVLELGFPQFLYYQHLPHLSIVLMQRLLLGHVSLITVFNLVRYLLLVGFPLTVFWSLRKLNFSHAGAITAATLAPFFAGNFGYGFEYDSYVWRGFGMYTQIWAMHLSFICLALLCDYLERGKNRVPAVLALAALILSHLVYAYMMAISAAVLFAVGLTRSNARQRSLRFALVWTLSALITCYFWLPFILSKVYLGASPYLQRWKYDSFGAQAILQRLASGDLFDHGRLPVMTALVATGLLAAALTRTRQAVLAGALFVTWLLLYFGRVTWGSLLDLLPMHECLIMHRFIGGVDMAALLLIAVGAGWLWQFCGRWQPGRQTPVFVLLTLLLMLPALVERHGFYRLNDVFLDRSARAVDQDEGAATLIERLRTLPPGRTFAGLRTDWGKDMKFGDLAFSDLLTLNQIPAVSAPYQSLSLNADLLWDFDYRNPDDYLVFNVRYVVAPSLEPMPGFLKRLQTAGRYTLYEAESGGHFALGRSDLAFEGRQSELLGAARAWHARALGAAGEFPRVALKGMQAPPSDLVSLPLADAPRQLGGFAAPPLPAGSIAAQSAQSQRYSASVQLQDPAMLVLKVSYHPNWQATVDGVPVPTVMLLPSYIGIELRPGAHEVVVAYRSQTARNLLIAFGLALLVLLVVLARPRKTPGFSRWP